MWQRITIGLSLARSSWRVLMGDKKLLMFPIISLTLTMLVIASFGIPLGMLFDDGHLRDESGKLRVWVYPIAFAAYFLAYAIVIFCNAALFGCAMLRLDGQPASVADGIRIAMSRLRNILAWAALSACVGVVLMIIESHKRGGELVARLIGSAWSVMTFFAVPVLVVQNVGPVDAIKGSVSLLRRTWGEALVGKTGLGLVSFLLFLPALACFGAGYYLLSQDLKLSYVLFGLAGVCMLVYFAVSSALNTIFLSALYQYASFQRVPEGFDAETMAGAFSPKTSS